VNQYAAPMWAPTASGALRARPGRAGTKITSSSPAVAMTSDRKCAAEARCLAEMLAAGSANVEFAATAPAAQSATCAGGYAAASRQDSPLKRASTKDTTGLK